MNTQLKTILRLMSEKYTTNYIIGSNPALVIYDDGSGRIIRNALDPIHANDNNLFSFDSIQELVEHLRS